MVFPQVAHGYHSVRDLIYCPFVQGQDRRLWISESRFESEGGNSRHRAPRLLDAGPSRHNTVPPIGGVAEWLNAPALNAGKRARASWVRIPAPPWDGTTAARLIHAPVAQSDRASDYGSEGWGFESLRAHRTATDRDTACSHRGAARMVDRHDMGPLAQVVRARA
jgi:hypothetical protein